MSLFQHIQNKDLEGLRIALQDSPDLNEVDHWNRDLVALAIVHRQPEMAKMLLAAGVPLRHAAATPFVPAHSALQSAVTEGFTELIPLLLEAGGQLTERIVVKAVQSGHAECLDSLLPYTPDDMLAKLKLEEGTLLHMVVSRAGTQPFWIDCTRRLVTFLVDRGVSLQEPNSKGATALKLASRFRLFELFDLLGGKATVDEHLAALEAATGFSLERWPIFRSQPDVYVTEIPARQAWDGFDDHVRIAEPLGYWPLVLGPRQARDFGLMAEAAEHFRKASKTADLEAWLANRLAKLRPSQGPWEERPQRTSSFLEEDSVVLALVPGPPEELMGRLGPVGVNDCPSAAIHASMLRRWKERYGARVFGLNGRVLELRVTHPPQDREQALALALESWAYCSTGKGDMTQQHQAAFLMQPLWFFWWD